MIKKDDGWFNLDNHQFEYLVLFKPGGKDAWRRFQEILYNGGKPIVFHSKIHGFSVINEKTNNPIEKKRLTSMKILAKPYQDIIEAGISLHR